jgi:hypothetical protein
MLTQCAANPRVQPNEVKVAAHQFQPTVGRELFVTKLTRKFVLDRRASFPLAKGSGFILHLLAQVRSKFGVTAPIT